VKARKGSLSALVATSAVVTALLAVVTNVATAALPSWLSFLQPAWHAWLAVAVLVALTVAVAVALARRAEPADADSLPAELGEVADALALRMFTTWSQQARRRGLEMPAPLAVRWQWAGGDVAVAREELLASPRLPTDPQPLPAARSTLPGQPEPSRREPGPIVGSGLVTRLHDRVYARLAHGRLVLLGGPGSGKTATMVLLLVAALHQRSTLPAPARRQVPVPVWLTAGSWNPAEQSVRDWAAATIGRDHAFLRAARPGPATIEELIDTGSVALFVDGLDEMPDALRPHALRRLHEEASGIRLVLTCRPEQFRSTVTDAGPWENAAVIELQPVGPAAAAGYLLDGQVDAARAGWQQVAEAIRREPDGVLAGTLSTPLALSLAKEVYTGADPTVLITDAATSGEALLGGLLDRFVAGAYPHERDRKHATWWLGWVAASMDDQPGGPTRDLAWWHITMWIPGRFAATATGLLSTTVFTLCTWFAALWWIPSRFWMVTATIVCVAFWGWLGYVTGYPTEVIGPRKVTRRWPTWPQLRRIMSLAMDSSGEGRWLTYWHDEIWTKPSADSPDATPETLYRDDARSSGETALMVGLACALPSWLIWLSEDWRIGVTRGLLMGISLAMYAVVSRSAVPMLLLSELGLRIGGHRVHFIRLLETALDRQVLRQAGAVYQFRHAALQDRLAAQYRALTRPSDDRLP
jgi:hypothetical protein